MLCMPAPCTLRMLSPNVPPSALATLLKLSLAAAHASGMSLSPNLLLLIQLP